MGCITDNLADGEDCGVLETQYDITHEQFLEWNPTVSPDCVDGFWKGESHTVLLKPWE